jgi:hypothetical protein
LAGIEVLNPSNSKNIRLIFAPQDFKTFLRPLTERRKKIEGREKKLLDNE